ncbi:MAG: lysine biosynthesis protein LysW [Anaerolineae bacterium]
MAVAVCPGCDEDVRLSGRLKVGQHVSCPSCGSLLEVVSVGPVELDWAFEDEEDLDEDETIEDGDDDEEDDDEDE